MMRAALRRLGTPKTLKGKRPKKALGDYSLKNTRNASTAYFVSFTPAVSTAECMASWGSPMSTVETDTWAVEMLPRVLPPAMSERLA